MDGAKTDVAEDRLSLRLLVLTTSLWVALSLSWAGAALWIWVGGATLNVIGHAFSWHFRSTMWPVRSALVGLVALATVPLAIPAVTLLLNGVWLPAAQFLLLFQGIASFELRSRTGLHASIGISEVIFFLVSQGALDPTFAIFLMGYTTLFFSFLSMSFLVDQARRADIRWFESRFSFALFWSAVFFMSLAVSFGIFLLLPKQFLDPVNGAHVVLLPVRASRGVDPVEFIPAVEAMPVASALSITAAGKGSGSGLAEDSTRSQSPATSETGPVGESRVITSSSPNISPSDSELGMEPAPGPSGPETDPGLDSADGDGEYSARHIVMQVRSSVMTYWRGRAFDAFDGQHWTADPAARYERTEGSAGAVFMEPKPHRALGWLLYPQTYFVGEAGPTDTVFSGYAPVRASVPVDDDGAVYLGDGTIYRVISLLPDFALETLEKAAPSIRLEPRYHRIPSTDWHLSTLAARITDGAYTDLERTQRIVTYLDRNYEFDFYAPDQLALSSSRLEYSDQATPGTSMDFATATVLLARAAGIPARLATGYLPGVFDPLSGTYVVRSSDRHAWAEVYFGGYGWVPVDSSPRLAGARLDGRTTYGPRFGGGLFEAGYTDHMYDSLRSSPGWLAESIRRAIGAGGVSLLASVIAMSFMALGAFIVWRLRSRLNLRNGPAHYTPLQGVARTQLLSTYLDAERLLTRAGLGPRGQFQTLGEYVAPAEAMPGEARASLVWLRTEAWRAAYDPRPYDGRMLPRARQHLRRLKSAIKADRRRLQRLLVGWQNTGCAEGQAPLPGV